MKNTSKLFGIIAIVVLLGLADCTTTSGSISAQTAQSAETPQITTAAQLAAELNAMNNGSASVNGNTVTLTRGVGGQRNITVPAGVSLEITGDGGIWLYNAALTVNGTVNAPADRIGPNTSEMERQGKDTVWLTINGNGIIYLKSKGHLLNAWRSGITITLDGVTLVGLADNDHPLVNVNDGGELILKSGKITGNTRTGESGGGVGVWNNGTFIMEGGEISGNSAAGGGGVQVSEGSTFIMTGGTISANSVTGNGPRGGGVHVNNGSTFIMEGGEISGNTATGNEFACGGGVQVWRATFIMKDGTISGNRTDSRIGRWPLPDNNGGGVSLARASTFTMEGGTISGNSITGIRGSGVEVDGSGTTFTMTGGTITGIAGHSGNLVDTNAGGVFNRTGGVIGD